MLVNYSEKNDYNTKITEIRIKIITDHDHDKYITTQVKIRKFYCKISTSKIQQEIVIMLISKKRQIFMINQKQLNKNVTSNKKEFNELSKKLRQYQQND